MLISARIYGELVPVWRDGLVLDDRVDEDSRPIVVARAGVRVTPESPEYPAGFDTLAQAVATLYAVYGIPLELGSDDPEALAALFRRPGELEGFPEAV